MAKRSYLTDSESKHCFDLWRGEFSPEVSSYLKDRLLEKLDNLPSRKELQIFGLGSLARDELCPHSDIDLILLGPEKHIKSFMQASFDSPLKIRARTFQQAEEVFMDVETFDLLSMMDIMPLFGVQQQTLSQLRNIEAKTIHRERRKILSVLRREKKERRERFDSLVSYLEPNLKMGAGGLRDIQQSLYLYRLFPEAFVRSGKNKLRLEREKKKLLYWRQGLHLLGFNDAMVAQSQLDFEAELNFNSRVRLMTTVEKCFSQSAFYSSWAFAKLKKDKVAVHVPKDDFIHIRQLKKSILNDPTELTQEILRDKKLYFEKTTDPYKQIRKLLNAEMNEEALLAVFGSKMMSQIFPDLKKVEGLVQHDQYHLLTVDAHTKQAMRVVLRLRSKPQYLGKGFSKLVKKMTSKDWEVLFWSAFFHDLAKGRKGDHSSVGKRLAEKILRQLNFPDLLVKEIAWMVENHLIFSTGAFRRNPQSPKTLHWLIDRGAKAKKASRLAVFTAIDIFATNPTAWNEWKEKLIIQLHDELLSNRTKKLERFLYGLSRGVLNQNLNFYSKIDQRLISELPAKYLRLDLKRLQEGRHLEPMIVAADSSRYWIRFHNPVDEDGLFMSYVRALHASGLSVSEAFVQSFEEYGVYDWFLVRGSRTKGIIRKRLMTSLNSGQSPELPEIKYEKIEVVEQGDDTAIISFRGLDKKGALLCAAASLYSSNLPILWAKVVTWGRRIDDVFCVKAPLESLEKYKKKVVPRMLE